MKSTLKWAAATLLLLALLVLGALATAVQGEPAIQLQQEPLLADVARAVALVRLHDPRRNVPGRTSTATLSDRDVDMLLNHAARGRVDVASRASFERGAATLHASVHLPPNPFGHWLNLEVRLVQTGTLPVLDRIRAGRLPVPVWVGEWLLRHAAARSGLSNEIQMASKVVQRVIFMPQYLTVVYAWQVDSAQNMLAALVPADEQQRLRAHSDRLAQVAAAQPPGPMAPLTAFVSPMFELARQRTQAGGDAAAENRAAIAVLTLYANGGSVGTLLPEARNWPQARPLRLTLGGREDFPLHLLVSAVLASEGTSPLSRAVGVYKEVADSRGGTGFSFNDMAANRAGTRIGEMAVQQPARLQAALARGLRDSDILPRWDDLPEFMAEPEFLRRFGGVGAPAYVALIGEIDRRVDALPVLR